jgi:hypothetical protein
MVTWPVFSMLVVGYLCLQRGSSFLHFLVCCSVWQDAEAWLSCRPRQHESHLSCRRALTLYFALVLTDNKFYVCLTGL